ELRNDGVTVISNDVTGYEAADTERASLIELDISVELNDDDGSEQITSILLSNLPDGFLVFTGTGPGDAAASDMADNAGGDGTNTWVLAGEGEALPPYIAILPPQYWSGTLSGLKLIVTSGEKTLDETLRESFDLGE